MATQATRRETISDDSPMSLKLAIAIAGGMLLAGGWATALHYQLSGLARRLDMIYETVSELSDNRVRRPSMLYWIKELKSRNPDLLVPEFPLMKED